MRDRTAPFPAPGTSLRTAGSAARPPISPGAGASAPVRVAGTGPAAGVGWPGWPTGVHLDAEGPAARVTGAER